MDFDLPECKKDGEPGRYYQLRVANFSPTQNAVGMDEVNVKTAKIKKYSKKKLKEYLYLRPVPLVIGQGKFYLIDRHHMSRSLWESAGQENDSGLTRDNAQVVVKVTENWEFIQSGKRFWKAMDKNHWVYPFDYGGGGPLNVAKLKERIQDLRHDPYRSLAWYVRKRFGYFKDMSNPIFAEFKWANFLRTRIQLGDSLLTPDSGVNLEDILLEELDEDDRDAAIDYAVALARSKDARDMPGHVL